LLDDAQVSELEQQLEQTTEEEQQLNKQLQQTQAVKNWCTNVIANEKTQKTAQQQLTTVKEQEQLAKGDLELLAQSSVAEPLRAPYEKMVHYREQYQQTVQQVTEQTAQLAKLDQAVVTSSTALSQLKASQVTAEQQRKVIEQVVHEKIQPLEHTIAHQTSTVQETQNSVATQSQALKSNTESLTAVVVAQQQASTKVAKQQAYLANNQTLQQLPEKLPLWQNQYQQLTTQQANVQRLLTEQNSVEQTLSGLSSKQQVQQQQIAESAAQLQQLTDQKNVIAEQVQQLVQSSSVAQMIFANIATTATLETSTSETAQDTALSFNQLSSALNQAVADRQNQQLVLKEAIQLAQRFAVLAHEQKTIAQQQEQDQQQLQVTEQELSALRQSYSTTKQQKKDVETLLSQQQTIMALSDHRAKLQPEEACPLCGSVEHPAINDYQALDTDEHQQRLSLLDKELAKIEKQGNQFKDVKAQLIAQLNAHQNRLQSITNDQHSIEQHWETLNFASKNQYESPFSLQLSLQGNDVENALNKQLTQSSQQLTELICLQQKLQENSQTQQQNTEQIIHCDKQLSTLQSQLQLVQEQGNAQYNLQTKIAHSLALAQQELVALNRQLLADISTTKIALPDASAEASVNSELDSELGNEISRETALCIDENWLNGLVKQVQEYQATVNTHQAAQQQLSSLDHQLSLLKQQVDQQQSQLNQTESQLSQQQNELAANNASRLALFDELCVDELSIDGLGIEEASKQNTAVLRDIIAKQRQEHETALKAAEAQHHEKMSEQQGHKGQLTTANAHLTSLLTQYEQVETDWQQLFSSSNFDNEDKFLLALISPTEKQQLNQLANDISDNKKQAQMLIAQSDKVAAELAQQKLALSDSNIGGIDGINNFDDELVSQALVNVSESLRKCQQKMGQYSQQINHDQANKVQQQSLLEQIKQAQLALDDLSHLNALIGSADGAKFRRFAQSLTLENLVYLANAQLERLFGRYQLQCQQSDTLALEVVDTWQGDAARDIKTLSGGESFLISLALALALSDLVSNKTSIDSLFLDEGFGTLDNDTLEVALDALDNLNASGKMIGVISHVDALKERIGVQIKVRKLSGLGISSLDKQYEFNAQTTNELTPKASKTVKKAKLADLNKPNKSDKQAV